MDSETLELEGLWEEVREHDSELEGKRVYLKVLPTEIVRTTKALPYRPASGRSVLRHAGKWSGDDLHERLQEVTECRSPTRF